jgi:hypothetical protein
MRRPCERGLLIFRPFHGPSRVFGSLTIEETAKVLNISASTVKNDWAMAKAWLMQRLDR